MFRLAFLDDSIRIERTIERITHTCCSCYLLSLWFLLSATGYATSISFSYIGEGMVIGFCIIPTLIYNNIILSMFLRTYRDGGLLQTGRLHYVRRRSSRSISSHMEREGTNDDDEVKLFWLFLRMAVIDC